MKAKGILSKVQHWQDRNNKTHHTLKLEGEDLDDRGYSGWETVDYQVGDQVEIEYTLQGQYRNISSVTLTKQATLPKEPGYKNGQDMGGEEDLIDGVLIDYSRVHAGVQSILGKKPEDIPDGLTQVSTVYIELGKRRRRDKW